MPRSITSVCKTAITSCGYEQRARDGFRSIFSGSTTGGIYAESSLAASQVNVGTSVTSNNGTGIINAGGVNTLIVISNTEIAFNATHFSGAVQSFGNSRIVGSGAI
jgi:hypothetical protein